MFFTFTQPHPSVRSSARCCVRRLFGSALLEEFSRPSQESTDLDALGGSSIPEKKKKKIGPAEPRVKRGSRQAPNLGGVREDRRGARPRSRVVGREHVSDLAKRQFQILKGKPYMFRSVFANLRNRLTGICPHRTLRYFSKKQHHFRYSDSTISPLQKLRNTIPNNDHQFYH